MSPRLIAIFAGLVLLISAIVAVFVFTSGEGSGISHELLTRFDRGGENKAAEKKPGPVLPTFDIVRVDANGQAVIAGRGVRKADLSILANGKEIASEKINDDGEWATYVETPLDEGAQELSLVMTLPNGEVRKSKQVVVITVPSRLGEKPLVVLGEPGKASRILQSPADSDPMILAVDVIDYDDEGGIMLSGRAMPNTDLRIYVDNKPSGDTTADDKGVWSFYPDKPIMTGRHKLRVDQLAPDGRVIARVEVPFERAEPADIMDIVSRGGGRIVVQPGNSLWRIARRVYGSGYEYTIIYDANQGQIQDPNMIYPGQLFDIPQKHIIDDEIHLIQ